MREDNPRIESRSPGKNAAKKPTAARKPSAARRPASSVKTGKSKSGNRKPAPQKSAGAASRKGAASKSAQTQRHPQTACRKSNRRRAQTGGFFSHPAQALRNVRALHIHIALSVLIVVILAVGIFKLIRWNRGVESGYDPNATNTGFDTETEDFRVAVTSEMRKQQVDDGVTSILLLGNGTLASARGEADGIDTRLEELTGGKVYNAGLNRTYLSVKNAVYDESYQTDVFSLYWIVSCITMQDFTLLEDNARSWDRDENVTEVVEMLKNLDMNAIDVITIMYDYHDYESKRLLAGPYDDTLPASCCGCLLQSIRLLKNSYPHIQIIVSSPYFCYIEDENGELRAGSTFNLGQGTLADYMIAYKNIAVSENVAFIDNYFGTIHEDNYEDYLEEDKEQLNAKGREAIAARIAEFIGGSPGAS